jgi:hypothetical protein
VCEGRGRCEGRSLLPRISELRIANEEEICLVGCGRMFVRTFHTTIFANVFKFAKKLWGSKLDVARACCPEPRCHGSTWPELLSERLRKAAESAYGGFPGKPNVTGLNELSFSLPSGPVGL